MGNLFGLADVLSAPQISSGPPDWLAGWFFAFFLPPSAFSNIIYNFTGKWEVKFEHLDCVWSKCPHRNNECFIFVHRSRTFAGMYNTARFVVCLNLIGWKLIGAVLFKMVSIPCGFTQEIASFSVRLTWSFDASLPKNYGTRSRSCPLFRSSFLWHFLVLRCFSLTLSFKSIFNHLNNKSSKHIHTDTPKHFSYYIICTCTRIRG